MFGANTNFMLMDGETKEARYLVPGDVIMGNDCTPRTITEKSWSQTPTLFKIISNNEGRHEWYCTSDQILCLCFNQQPHGISSRGCYRVCIIILDDVTGLPVRRTLRDNNGNVVDFLTLIEAKSHAKHLVESGQWNPLIFQWVPIKTHLNPDAKFLYDNYSTRLASSI